MKKLSTLFIIAFALILGLTQCRKNAGTIVTPDNPAGDPVFITLNVGDGDKHIVYPSTGAVVYTDGDKIYVGNNGKYIGYLEYAYGVFSGTIYGPKTTDFLHFYFVGDLETGDITEGTTTSFNVNVANQSSSLPVLSYGHSTQKYVDGTTTYGCTLLNKCALVNITFTRGDSNDVTLNGMLITATVDFTIPGIIPGEATGDITLNSESETSKWAILLPTSAETVTSVTIDDFDIDVTVPAITANDYLAGANALAIDNAAVDFVFTVDSDGKTVRFSPGNLQYRPSDHSWQFAANQYDIIGHENCRIDPNYHGWLDLFGWGTGDDPTDMTWNNSFLDWGRFCGDPTGNSYRWFTLSDDQWQYIFTYHTYGLATVNDVHGIVILPDSSSLTVNVAYDSWSDNVYTTSEWSEMEAYGAVFLPAAGRRDDLVVSHVGAEGYYWSSSLFELDTARSLYFGEDVLITVNQGSFYGFSVRLVR